MPKMGNPKIIKNSSFDEDSNGLGYSRTTHIMNQDGGS